DRASTVAIRRGPTLPRRAGIPSDARCPMMPEARVDTLASTADRSEDHPGTPNVDSIPSEYQGRLAATAAPATTIRCLDCATCYAPSLHNGPHVDCSGQ